MNTINYQDLEKIETATNLNKETFDERYGIPGKPVLIRDLATSWPALNLWDFDFFRNNFGEVVVNGEAVNGDQMIKRSFKMAEFIDHFVTNPDVPPYYLKNCNFHIGTVLRTHYTPPDYFNCWYANLPDASRKYNLSWLYIGARDTFSSLHLDIWNTSAWHCVITGKKLWLFFDKEQQEFLYDGMVNPFNPDLAKFEKYKNAKPLICIQEPGDVVFTPGNWWHAVYNLEAGISVTENFINSTNWQNVLTYFQKSDMMKSHKTMSNIVAMNLKNENNGELTTGSYVS
ncbi:cupin-like domain-containing protein [Pedobacter sp. AW31-3R]|uniref:cupin-like domain-containing protein n=1 Tax=Pedobacter sp. AW31-3R TaxID=3445781 RepID=UPI003FA0B9B1